MTDKLADFGGGIPANYDHGLGPHIFVDYAADPAARVAGGAPVDVLELAAGTGIVSRALRDALAPTARLLASDLSEGMLAVARGKFGAGERVEFRTADATALPFEGDSFDAVACQFGVMFFPDQDEGYREAWRVLRCGGHYHFNVSDSIDHNPFARVTGEVATGFFPEDPPRFYDVPFGYYRIEPVKEALLAAGFADIEAAVVTIDKEIPEAAVFARGLVHGNPLIEEIKSRGGVEPEAVVEALTRALQDAFGADPGRMPLQAIVFSARKP